VPSTFAEDLPKSGFEGRLGDYPISTAGEKASEVGRFTTDVQAMEVYERLVKENDMDPPDLVISGWCWRTDSG